MTRLLPRMRSNFRVGALVATLAMAACAEGSELPPGLQCAATSECQAPLGCDFNFCVAPGTNRLTLLGRVAPPAATGLLPQQIAKLDLAAGPDLLVSLLPSAVVKGVVTIKNDALTGNVSGTITVRSPDVIDGIDARFTATSRLEVGADGYGFELTVLPGRSYEGVFRPDNDELPSHRFVMDAAAVASGRFDIVLPARAEYGQIEGRVRTAEGPKPILDARIVVLGEANELLAVTRTDPERGQFAVLVAPDVTRFRLKVEAPSDGVAFPDFVTDVTEIGAYVDVVVPDPPANVAAYDAVLRVVATEADAASATPVDGLTVTLQGQLDGGTLRLTGTTDEHGEVSFRVLSGTYECLVVVPPERPYASWHGLVDLSPQALRPRPAAWTITLPARPLLSGHVIDIFDMPVAGGTLTLERRVTRGAGEILAIAPPPVTTDIQDDGTFSLRLDPGTWDVMVAPDPATGAPHVHEPAVEIDAAGLDLELALPAPALIHLTVGAPSGEFLPDVEVELFLPGDDEVTAPRLLARGATGPDGFVDLLVPHR